ncbi:CBS domain-containing protein [Algivirga pacifica]|uniref:CBS domain-containing protein n=1 Tax=Algivirga pacifica TaxID=1162670 RepID=A0ABP9DDM3_9BACT
MIAKEFINHTFPSVKNQDITERIFDWMDEYGVRQLPVINDGAYVGIISEDELFELDLETGVNLNNQKLNYRDVFIAPYTHLYDILNIIGEHDIELVAVVDEHNKFLGTILIKELVPAIAKIFASQIPGGIIVLKIDAIQYSLAEISRLIEANGVRILSSFVQAVPDDPKVLFITLKLNTQDLSHVLATLERFSYQVLNQFSNVPLKDNSSERIQLLLKYLEM